MNDSEKASASYELTADICTVLVPGWPQEPKVVARQDGKDEVTVVVTKAAATEQWRLVRLRNGVLCTICYLTGNSPRDGARIERTVYDMVVHVPPSKLGKINVLCPNVER